MIRQHSCQETTLRESKAVVFDLDDTLYLERDFVKSGFQAVSQWLADHCKLDGDKAFDILWAMFCEGHRGDLFDKLVETFTVTDFNIGDLIAVYRQHTPNIAPFKGIIPLLKCLRKNNKLGLLSDGFLEVQKKKLDALGLAGYFDEVVFSDELGRDCWKPSTIPFEMIIQQLNVQPCEAVYIADNPEKDFKGPNKLGMDSIRIRIEGGEHYSKEPQSNEFAPSNIVYSVCQLVEELGVKI